MCIRCYNKIDGAGAPCQLLTREYCRRAARGIPARALHQGRYRQPGCPADRTGDPLSKHPRRREHSANIHEAARHRAGRAASQDRTGHPANGSRRAHLPQDAPARGHKTGYGHPLTPKRRTFLPLSAGLGRAGMGPPNRRQISTYPKTAHFFLCIRSPRRGRHADTKPQTTTSNYQNGVLFGCNFSLQPIPKRRTFCSCLPSADGPHQSRKTWTNLPPVLRGPSREPPPSRTTLRTVPLLPDWEKGRG